MIECEMFMRGRDVLDLDIGKIAKCGMETFRTLDSSKQTIATYETDDGHKKRTRKGIMQKSVCVTCGKT